MHEIVYGSPIAWLCLGGMQFMQFDGIMVWPFTIWFEVYVHLVRSVTKKCRKILMWYSLMVFKYQLTIWLKHTKAAKWYRSWGNTYNGKIGLHIMKIFIIWRLEIEKLCFQTQIFNFMCFYVCIEFDPVIENRYGCGQFTRLLHVSDAHILLLYACLFNRIYVEPFWQ